MTATLTLQARIRNIVVKTLDADPAKAVDEARLRADLGADDLDMFELVFAVEEEIDAEITDAQAETLKTVGDVVRLAEQLVGQREAA